MYIPTLSLIVTDVRVARPGFVHLFGAFPGPALLTQDDYGIFVTYLREPNEFVFASIEKARGTTKGFLHPEPLIEVDRDSAFDPERGDGEALGDLLMQGTHPHVVARAAGDNWSDPQRVLLWGGSDDEKQNDLPWIGFRRWRLMLAVGNGQQLLWERTVAR